MKFININNENPFDPTPKLKSSTVPILFIPFNYDKYSCSYCSYCGKKYFKTLLFKQKYCKSCLFWYIKCTTGDDSCLDVHMVTNNAKCIEHEATRNTDTCTRNIQEWCERCYEISYFNQIIINPLYDYYPSENVKDCKLCGKLVYKRPSSHVEFKLCSDCYQISTGWVESTLAKKPIPIFYLPWWDGAIYCIACELKLSFVSDCQKWCSCCYSIYTGCRYCLTTNIIFGPTNQSQCRKCKRISIIDIDITNISSRNHNVDEILYVINFENQIDQIADRMNDINNSYRQLSLYDFYQHTFDKFKLISNPKMKWVSYSQIKNLTEIARGGFGTIYKATWLDKDVAIKKFSNSQNISKYFLNELKSHYQCYDSTYIIKYIGITQDPKTKDYMLIMDYADGGDLHNYLQKDFANITWKIKLRTLWTISMGLKSIHDKNFIHRDFHSGNILLANKWWCIGDLGLSQPANNISINEIYGVMPYIAPEIFKGAEFSRESDIYSMGMIMWELTTGCKPFDNVEHGINLIYKIIDGKWPEITSDTPECYANLMKRCWDSDPSKRPSISEIINTVHNWYFLTKCLGYFEQAEKNRIELIRSKKLGPEFSEKPHPKAIFTSRPLSSLISKSSIMMKFNTKQDSELKTSAKQSNNEEYITKEHELDINNIQSGPLRKLVSTVNSSRKRNIEELKIENQNNETGDVSKLISKLFKKPKL